MSDAELQALLDAIPPAPNCPHSDYDTLKSERDTLQTENTQLQDHQCDCDSKVAAKEKEIINKIITDLELSTERERENTLEAVIAEIKKKITPPDNSQLSQLQTQLKNKEAQITELKKGNKSYLDLEKLVQQKQTENQALTTAKNSLESQLNEKQKELLNQVLKNSSETREKVYKEEIIKSIESSLTSQGIDSQKFRQKITALSSLTDIQQLSGKYSGQKLSEVEGSRRSAYSLNIALGVLSLASLIALAYLLIKGFGKEIGGGLKERKKK
jgi:chromosome segregation ATPase